MAIAYMSWPRELVESKLRTCQRNTYYSLTCHYLVLDRHIRAYPIHTHKSTSPRLSHMAETQDSQLGLFSVHDMVPRGITNADAESC